MTRDQSAELSRLAQAAQRFAEERQSLQQEVLRRIPDLAGAGAGRLSSKLHEWWALPDFAAFQKEVKKALKADIPLKERNAWESWISDNRARIQALTANIARMEAEINTTAYRLFGLTGDEIALLEANI